MRHPAVSSLLPWQYYFLAALCGLFAPIWLVASFAALLLVIYFHDRFGNVAKNLVILSIFFLSFIFSWLHFQELRPPDMPDWSLDKKIRRICGEAISAQGLPDNRLKIILKNIRPADAPESGPLPGLCSWTWENAPLGRPLPGQQVCISRPLLHAGGFSNDMRNQIRYYKPEIFWRIWSDGDRGQPEIMGQAFWQADWRDKLFLKFLSILTGEKISASSQTPLQITQSQAILAALLFGDRRFLSQKTVNAFGDASLAHSLALSGQHLGIAASIAFLMILCAARFFPGIYLRQPRAVLAGLAGLPIAMLYLWIGGAPASLLRAAGMLCFFVWHICRRNVYTLADLLFLTLFAILLFDPFAVFDIGLQMSALCVAVICLASPYLKIIKKSRKLPTWSKALIQILLISFIIQAALLPLGITRFQQPGFWFPLNLLWLPMLGIVVLPLGAAGLVLSLMPVDFLQILAAWLLKLACLPGDFLLRLLGGMTLKGMFSLPVFLSPHWTIFPAFGLLALAGARIFATPTRFPDKRATAMLCCAVLLLCVAPVLRLMNCFEDDFSIEALDVGQGQSLLINFPENGRIILDGGGSKSSRFDPGKNIISPLLTDNAAPRLSSIISSHPDLDHLGGLIFLIKKFAPDFLFHNGRPGNSSLGVVWEKTLAEHPNNILAEGDKLILGDPAQGLELQVLHPTDDEQWQGNSASIALRLTKHGEGLALFTGDAEKNTLKKLLRSGRDISAKVLFAPHHGSDKSFLIPFYRKVNPELVVVSCGYQNRWHYPGKKLVNYFKKERIPLLDTGNAGRIQMEFDKILKVKTAKKGDFIFDNRDNKP